MIECHNILHTSYIIGFVLYYATVKTLTSCSKRVRYRFTLLITNKNNITRVYYDIAPTTFGVSGSKI